MHETLPDYLKKRVERSFRHLLLQVESVPEEDAFRFRYPDWAPHRWGIGQDGSIAGIVYHVAAWKAMTLPVFLPGGRVYGLPDFDRAAAPDPGDWTGIKKWLLEVGTAWNAAVEALSDSDFDIIHEWEGATMPLSLLITEIMEHDIQHASQIEYLRQRLLVEPTSA